jgi:hypothetical protein
MLLLYQRNLPYDQMGILSKKNKSEKAKKIYLFGVQIFHKKYL